MALKELIEAIKSTQQKMAAEAAALLEANSTFKVGDLVEVSWGSGWAIGIVAHMYGHDYVEELKTRMYEYSVLVFDTMGVPRKVRRVFYIKGDPEQPEPEIRQLLDAAVIEQKLAA